VSSVVRMSASPSFPIYRGQPHGVQVPYSALHCCPRAIPIQALKSKVELNLSQRVDDFLLHPATGG
jgi:hypothetical protein